MTHLGDEERHLLREALGRQLEAELGGFDAVDESGVQGRVGELREAVLEGVHQQVVQVALPRRPEGRGLVVVEEGRWYL